MINIKYILDRVANLEGGEGSTDFSSFPNMPDDVKEMYSPVAEETEEVTEETSEVEEAPVVEEKAPIEFEIDGEKFDEARIRELKNQSMNYKDWLEQRQEVENLRNQSKDAVELFDYLKAKPELINKLYELDGELAKKQVVSEPDPMAQRLEALERHFQMQEIETTLNNIVSKDSMVTKEEILKIATESRTTIESAYNIWRGQNFDKILNAKLAEQSKELTRTMKKNGQATKTAIAEGDQLQKADSTYGLSDMEMSMSKMLGMTFEEYSSWKVK